MPKTRYGLEWPDSYCDLDIELLCFSGWAATKGGEVEEQQVHFKKIVRILWGPKSKKHFVWNPWNERMLEYAVKYKYLSLSGAAASGKTDFGAVWGIVNWLCAPHKTAVLFTSTSLSESKKRIWGRVEEYFMAACDDKGKPFLPGKLTSSTGKIKTQIGDRKFSDRCGMFLVAGDRAKEKENIGKLIGVHNERVFLICDEMPELSPALTEAAMGNLAVNPYFQMISIGNFASIYDPFGLECTPKEGWGSINEELDGWETTKGYCLRFDGLKSPNVLLGRKEYPGLYSVEDLEGHRSAFRGENTAGFWRMCRSFLCPEADVNRIYSTADFIKGDAHNQSVKWMYPQTKVAALDPAFATGGDKAIAKFGLLGMSTSGKLTLLITERLELHEDIRKKDENRSVQVAKLYRDACIKRNVSPENAAYDGSGGGIVFGGLLGEIWSNKLLGVQFGGAPSNRSASNVDRRPAKDAYANRVSELWFGGVEFFHSGQIKGLDNETAKDLTERRYESNKGANGLKVRVERKDEMKKRINHSPDDGDAFAILLELCRERLKFTATGMEGKQVANRTNWKLKTALVNRVYQNANYEPEEIAA